MDEDLELPLVWLIATIFNAMWKFRESKNKVEPYRVRAELEAKINLLRNTRFRNIAITIFR